MRYAVRYALCAMRILIAASTHLGFACMLSGLLLGCAKEENKPPWSGPARIALVAPQSGALKYDGQMLHLGALTAMHEARARDGDRKTEMVVYDSPCDAQGAAHVARRLAGDSSVCAVVGYLCAKALGAALVIYEEAGLALINPTVSAEYVRTQGERHLFSLLYGDDEQAAFLAAYVKKGLGLTRVAILSDGSTYGDLLTTSFLAEAERQALVLVAKVAVASNLAEVTQAVELMKAVGPEAIFLAAKENSASLFLLERQRQQLAGKVLGPDRLADLDFYEMTGNAAEGLLVVQPVLLGAPDFAETGFVQRFEMLHKRRPNWVAAAGYDATRLTLEALQRSGPKRDALLQALREISRPETSYRALMGPIFFREDGTTRRPFYVAALHGGELRAAEPSSVEFP